ncbi:MAG: bifunctional 4-hydroxy-3-methylbut-2-enyl diphosphate reductase/30S ribosomal protein S1, partial [Clostridia bacterium]|nr:bifunctional 4-hydroxy-3-methylbut-2-enyl diphosphate reductase/30S ribosomal protein S1 [Clostridia bacterium]
MIRVAETAGFCFGVNRAVETVYQLLDNGERVCTLGPIIHNPQLVESLEKRGVRIIEKPLEAQTGETVLVRSHGVPPQVLEELDRLGIRYVNATCPFVQKIHKIVREGSAEGKLVMIAGDKSHPEIEGVLGSCSGPYETFMSAAELEKCFENHPEYKEKSLLFCQQTTFNVEEWEKCLIFIKKVCTNASVFDTICNATANRQKEARKLSSECDLMLVVGGRHSSNTTKLRDVCAANCETYLIETADELKELPVYGRHNIGITAGASTPASIIKEVLVTMTEINETNELNFEEMLEESLKSLNTDEKVHGVVVGISPTEVYVDVGRKQAGFIPANELSNDPGAKPEELVKIGDEMDLLIMKTNDQEGTIMLSKKRIDAIKGWEDIAAAMDAEEILTGKVTEVVKGGVIVLYNGIRVFIPASQAVANRGDDLEVLKNTEVNFRIIEVNRQRRRAVGSIRSVLREQKKAAQAKFWETVEENQEFTGTVKSLTNFGAFVDLGGVDGMIHISELSWNRIKHPSEVVAVGDTVTVYVKSLDRENNKISLGYKKIEDNPWEIMKNQYPAGTVCEATVVGMTTFGAFAKILPGIDGLIHISQIADK